MGKKLRVRVQTQVFLFFFYLLSVCILPLVCSLQSAFYPQFAFYPRSAVCVLHWPEKNYLFTSSKWLQLWEEWDPWEEWKPMRRMKTCEENENLTKAPGKQKLINLSCFVILALWPMHKWNEQKNKLLLADAQGRVQWTNFVKRTNKLDQF